jgi:putative addiction module killer protein
MGMENRRNGPIDNLYSIMHTQVGAQFTVIRMAEFDQWLDDQSGKQQAIILARLDMVAVGHFGDHKRFEGLIELRWKNGTRVYTFVYGRYLVVALNGGDKNGQDRDIKKAKRIKNEILDGTRSI